MARNRVIYQSQALFIAPSSTGAQVSGSGMSSPNFGPTGPAELGSGISLLKKLDRVQSCNFNFSINRQDINEFGKLARIDSIVMEAPTVGLDFSYYVTDGFNERLMGFNVTGASITDSNLSNNAQSISGILADLQGNNYYILTVDEGEDVVGGTLSPNATVVGIGNGFITEYGFEASVGAIPTASVTVEAFNIKSDANETPLTIDGGNIITITGNSPAVDLFAQPATKLTAVNKAYKIDQANPYPSNPWTQFTTGDSQVTALRPGDIVLSFPTATGLSNISDAHIQSFSFTLPLSRTILQRLGNTFGFARVVDVPINMDVTISAIASELRDANLFDILANPQNQTFTIVLNNSASVGQMAYTIKGAIFQGESYSESIGDNQTVDLTYTVQVGGANDTTAGLFMSGNYATSLDDIVTNFYKLGTGKLN